MGSSPLGSARHPSIAVDRIRIAGTPADLIRRRPDVSASEERRDRTNTRARHQRASGARFPLRLHEEVVLPAGKVVLGTHSRLTIKTKALARHAMTESVPQENTQPQKLPEQVFHYTSLDALIKIVNTRELWCTALPYLNDSKERTFIFDAVKRRLPYLKEQDSSLDPDLGLRTLEVEDVSNVTSFADEAFVACFAENGDSLLHWRAYCPQQSGVAIGFHTACLAEAHISEKPEAGMVVPRVSFGKVGYVDTRETEVIDQIIYSAYESAKREVAKGKTPWVLNDHFRWALDYTGCVNKEKSFEVEDEWRLLLPYVKYREKQHSISNRALDDHPLRRHDYSESDGNRHHARLPKTETLERNSECCRWPDCEHGSDSAFAEGPLRSPENQYRGRGV